MRCGESACSSLESLWCSNDALVGSEVEASRITVAFLQHTPLVRCIYIERGCVLLVILWPLFIPPDTTSSPSVDAI